MRTEKVDDCGCVLERDDTGLHMQDCPLHAAAPDMLAALLEARAMLETAKQYFPKSITNRDRYSLLNVLANAIEPAIRKARGE